MYRKITDSTSKIELDNSDQKIQFFLDSTPQDFAACGIEADEEMIAEENSRASIHSKLIQLFDVNPEKIQEFEIAISSDPSNGYMQFVSNNII